MQILFYQTTDILALENSTKSQSFYLGPPLLAIELAGIGGWFTANEFVFLSRIFPILWDTTGKIMLIYFVTPILLPR